MPITLQQLLASRDARHAMQLRLLAEHSGKTLVCLTVVMPGSVKRNHASLVVARAAVEALHRAFGGDVYHAVERDLDTGYEAYFIVARQLLDAKRTAVGIEDTHPLGRLFDIDIIDHEGVPVPRSRVGGCARRCLVCSHDARYCMRLGQHSQQEIWAKIDAMVGAYEEGVSKVKLI